MPELTYDQAVLLRRAADGEPTTVAEADARGLIADGLLRVLTPQDVADIRDYRETVLETDRLEKELHRTLHPTGLEHVRFDLVPGIHHTHEQHADELRDRIDRCKSATSAAWLSLSERDLMHIDPGSCALTADGGALDITDPGKDAARAFVWSEAFETQHIRQDTLDARAARYIDIRQALLDKGFAGDPRLDLAAAILSRHETTIDRYCEYNRLAVHEQWLNYDRLPLLAALCRFEGSPGDIWPRFLADYERVLATDLGAGVEGRFVTLSLMTRRGTPTPRDVTDEALAQVMHIRGQLCLMGSPNEQTTNPVSASLIHSRSSTASVAAHREQLRLNLGRGGATMGVYATLAANVAITWNLFRSVSNAADAKLMEDNTVFDDSVERYDMLLGHFEGDDSRRAVPAIILALLPGTTDGNAARFKAVSATVGEHVFGGDVQTVALMLGDSACEDWFDLSEFPWEFTCMLHAQNLVSAFRDVEKMGMGPAMLKGTPMEHVYLGTNFTFHDMMEYARNYRKYRPSLTPRKGDDDTAGER